MNNGLIIYNFKRNKTKVEEAYEAEKEKEKEPGYVYQPQEDAYYFQFWGTLGGIVIVGGTLIEDVLTGGAGVADDAASFAFAYKLIFG